MTEYENLKNKLKDSKKIEVNEVEKENMDSIDNIDINKDKPSNIRILEFLKQSTNPYMFLIDNMIVKIEYGEKGTKLKDCINNLIQDKINSKNYQ